MLNYLMKYDLKKILKYLVWFYPISVVLAGISRLFSVWDDIQFIKIIAAIFTGATYSAIASILVNTFIHILRRFSVSFFKDTSYLTHTLPVKKDTLVLSKYLSSLIVIFLSVFVSVLSLFILLYSPELMQALKQALVGVVSGFNLPSGLFLFLVILAIFSQISAMMSLAFSAIVKGYSFNHKRGLKGFFRFALYYVICGLSTLVLITLVALITGNIGGLFSKTMSKGAFLCVLIVGILSYIGFAIGFYFYCKKEFNKGVNVD